MQKPATVGTSDVKLLDDNKNRRYLLIVNNSTGVVYLLFGDKAATVGTGIPLRGQGSFWESPVEFYKNREQNDEVLGVVRAISDTAAQDVRVFES